MKFKKKKRGYGGKRIKGMSTKTGFFLAQGKMD